MKKLTIGKRIILGFSALIVITVVLGLISVLEMTSVSKGAVRLEEAYIPEIIVATDMERNLILAMFENRGFGFTEDRSFYEKGKGYSEKVIQALDQAKALAREKDLPVMQKEEPIIRDSATKYFASAEVTAGIMLNLAQDRAKMDEQTEAFHSNCLALLEDIEGELALINNLQEDRMKLVSGLRAQQEKATVASALALAGGEGTQLSQSLEDMQQVLNGLTRLKGLMDTEGRLSLYAAVEASANDYMSALAAYQEAFEKGDPVSAARLLDLKGKVGEASNALSESTRLLADGLTGANRAEIGQRLAQMKLINEIMNLGLEAEVDVLRAQAFRKPERMRDAISKIEEMDSYFPQLQEITRHPDELNLLLNIDAASETYKEAIETFLGSFSENQALTAERTRLANAALTGVQNLEKSGESGTKRVAEETVNSMTLASTVLLIGVVAALGFGIALAILITRSITAPLMAAIGNLSIGANETKNASGQVSSASQSLAEGASEQAASLEETSSSMEEMTSMVARNAEVATKTNEQARAARNAAEDGVKSMGELRNRADAVSASAKEMETAMQAIKQSSDSISKIIKTIDEIAFQTNILALNAAVEAARAGEAGAGFAVVADEVRSLARRAAEAAQETAAMIEDSMQRSERGVQVNETVGKNLVDVLEKANQVEEGLRNITGMVSNVNGAMEELEASVREQQDGIAQINTAVGQVNEVTQANAASAEEAASASEEMNAQSVSMMEIVETLTEMVTGKRTDGVNVNKPVKPVQAAPKRVLSLPESRPRAKALVASPPKAKALPTSRPKVTSQPKQPRRLVAKKATPITKARPQVKKRTAPAQQPEKTFSLPGDFE